MTKLNQPLDIALIGTGFCSQMVYRLLFAALRARGDLASEVEIHAARKAHTGIDPLDVEGMLDYTAPRA